MTQGLTYAEWQEKVTDLEQRVEGLEHLLADAILDGRVTLTFRDPVVVATVESDRQHPSPAWGRP